MGRKKQNRDEGLSPEEQAYRDEVRPYLLQKAYHLPGNNWVQDWWQFMVNNHPLFGICLHHRFHPVKRCVRFVSLIGSILFGIAVTNVIYLAFVHYDQDYDKTYAEYSAASAVSAFGVDESVVDQNVQKHTALVVTNGNLALWTVGAALHALYDNIVWALATCACCSKRMGSDNAHRFQTSGAFLVILFVIVVTALATFAVAIRLAVADVQEGNEKADEIGLSKEDFVELKSKAQVMEFGFMIAYCIELALTFFVFYPIIGTILFSGCLTCGRTSLLGGRPYELKHAKQEDNDVEHSRPVASPQRPEQPRKVPTQQSPRTEVKGQNSKKGKQQGQNSRPVSGVPNSTSPKKLQSQPTARKQGPAPENKQTMKFPPQQGKNTRSTSPSKQRCRPPQGNNARPMSPSKQGARPQQGKNANSASPTKHGARPQHGNNARSASPTKQRVPPQQRS